MLVNPHTPGSYLISAYNSIAESALSSANTFALQEYIPGGGPAAILYAIAATERSAAYATWAGKVAPDGIWDHKTPILAAFDEEQTVYGQHYTHDTWSNIHYGYVGRALGFTGDELLYGAGLAQFLDEARKGFSNDNYVDYLKSGNAMQTYLDNGNDPAFIQFGIRLWDTYGDSLTREIFVEELSQSGLSVGAE